MAKSLISHEFQSVYMGLAKHVATMKNSCYSRKIGTVIIDPKSNTVSSIGWNGPPRKCLDMDSYKYLRDWFWPQLTPDEQQSICEKVALTEREIASRGGQTTPDRVDPKTRKEYVYINKFFFAERAQGCKICPRRYINAGPGERNELCTCVHSELNAILNARKDLSGNVLFCYADVGPCQPCAAAMIQAGISECFFLKGKESYHLNSVKMLESVGINYYELEIEQ